MDRIWIISKERCSKLAGIHPPMVIPSPFIPNDKDCCMPCLHRSYNKLEQMLKSNFANDSSLRQELLTYYFKVVQFEWKQDCEHGEAKIFALPRFFETFTPSSLVGQFRHLTIHIPWKYSGFKASDWGADDAFRTDSVHMGKVLAVLHKYKIKAELTLQRRRLAGFRLCSVWLSCATRI